MLIAMQTRGSKVAEVVFAAVHFCFLVFYSWLGGTVLGERPGAIATPVALLLNVFSQCPPTVIGVHRSDIGVSRDGNKQRLFWWLKLPNKLQHRSRFKLSRLRH